MDPGSHVEFQISTKNTLKITPKCLCICTGDSEISLNAKNVHWIILYQICVFGADLKFNMAARVTFKHFFHRALC
jgi:hypothetical protein